MSNPKYKILLVEDDTNIRTFVTALLESNDYQVLTARNAAQGELMYGSHVPDLVILDLGLPDDDGGNLLQHIRRRDLTPVIVLSARTDEREKVRLLDMGANDYVTKPFGSSELMARVRSSLRDYRRHSSASTVASIFQAGGLEIRYESRRVFLDGTEIKLTQTEFNILTLLSRHSGKVLTYAAIIKEIWRESASESNIKRLQVNMANIRKKLGYQPGKPTYVVNELGVGYRLQDEL